MKIKNKTTSQKLTSVEVDIFISFEDFFKLLLITWVWIRMSLINKSDNFSKPNQMTFSNLQHWSKSVPSP